MSARQKPFSLQLTILVLAFVVVVVVVVSYVNIDIVLYIQGVNKLRVHCSITYNFRINVHSILKFYRHTNIFSTKVHTILHLLQLYYI